MTGYRRRELGAAARAALAEMPVVVVTGLRQAGKSTFLQHEPGLGQRLYASLDEFAQPCSTGSSRTWPTARAG